MNILLEKQYFLLLHFSSILLLRLYPINCEYFTSIAELEKLLHTENKIAKALTAYMELEEERLKRVKWFYNHYAELHKIAKNNTQEFLTNPVNAYLLIKRLTADWEDTNGLIKTSDNKALIDAISSQGNILPNNDDLVGASEALMRLQETYKLDSVFLAKGEIKGATSALQLTAGDCFEIGRHAYDATLFNFTISWMQEAVNKIDQEEKVKTVSKGLALQYIAFSKHFMHNNTGAAHIMENIMEIDPDHPNAKNLHAFFLSLEDKKSENEATSNENDTPDSILFDAYEKLCRGEPLKTRRQESQLYCQYTTNRNSYLLLQPIKTEVFNLKPKVVLYYDVLKEWEVNAIKDLSVPKLERSQVLLNGEIIYSNVQRISKSTRLYDWDHFIMPRIHKRMADITGLDTTHAESLVVMNYGIGGHYVPHYDFGDPEDDAINVAGNRIATWMFYLSDVAAGGSTVFPKLGVEVKPVKGSAIFWYNLHKNGDVDTDTKHAACPVLVGSKWVANAWLHEHGNEFKRPCDLNQSE